MNKQRRFKNGDRVKSIYFKYEPLNIGTILIENDEYLIIYDNELETKYQLLDDEYLELVED